MESTKPYHTLDCPYKLPYILTRGFYARRSYRDSAQAPGDSLVAGCREKIGYDAQRMDSVHVQRGPVQRRHVEEAMTIDPDEAREKRAAQPERLPRPPRMRSRLPHGARLEATYDAEEARWTGTLRVGETVVEASCSGVMTLLHVLDEKLRKKLGIDHDGALVQSKETAT
jgi:hypothetical protein